MEDRGFTELDLRRMLEEAMAWRPSANAGRFIIEARHENRRWEVVVEPDIEELILVVVTAYPVDR